MLFRWTHPCGQWFLRPCGPRCYCDTCLVPTWFYSWAPAASVLSLGHAQFLVYSITNLVVQQIDIAKVMISLHILLATTAHIWRSSICISPTESFCYYHVVEVLLGLHGCDLSKEKKSFLLAAVWRFLSASFNNQQVLLPPVAARWQIRDMVMSIASCLFLHSFWCILWALIGDHYHFYLQLAIAGGSRRSEPAGATPNGP